MDQGYLQAQQAGPLPHYCWAISLGAEVVGDQVF